MSALRFRRAAACAALVAAALAGGGLLSCSGEPPSIVSVRWTLVLRDPAGPPPLERLSVFVSASDADGKDDIEDLTVVHDEARLAWKFDSSSWVDRDEGGARWLGSNAIATAEGGALPRGRFRMILRDAAGETDEASFSLSDPGSRPQASLRLDGSSVIVQAPWAVSQFIVLDASGATLASVPASRGRSDLASVLSSTAPGLAKGLALMSLDEPRNLAIETPVVKLP